jgi:hypothetical protein
MGKDGMSTGILAVWSDITPEGEADYVAWYEREHMFERLEVPGFRRARHYETLSGSPRFFTWFELDAPAVVATAAYLAQANRSSPWTRRVLPHFRNTNRTAGRVLRRLGRGFGSAALTVRMGIAEGREAALIGRLAEAELPALVSEPGIVAGQLWRADHAATFIEVEDRSLRHGRDLVAELTLFLEATDTAPLAAALEGRLAAANLVASGALEPLAAVHRLVNGAEAGEAPAI